MTTQNLTPIIHEDADAIIHHVNDEHGDELTNMAAVLLDLTDDDKHNLKTVVLQKIYQEGLLLTLHFKDSQTQKILPFENVIESLNQLNEQYVLLLQKSDKQQGKKTILTKNRQFVVQNKELVSPNMYRLTVQTDLISPADDLSAMPAGYAFLFNVSLPNNPNSPNEPNKTARPYRYYTLRKAWQNQDNNSNLAWIDIFYHSDGDNNNKPSLGETWLKSLKPGDVIETTREFVEKTEHLTQKSMGQVLLIVDETSLPTAARLLETDLTTDLPTNQNQKPPIVIIFLQNEQDLAYLDEVAHYATILPVIDNKTDTADKQIFAKLNEFLQNQSQNQPLTIDSVWGGLEAGVTKSLRPLLCELLNLTRKEMVLKVYWRRD